MTQESCLRLPLHFLLCSSQGDRMCKLHRQNLLRLMPISPLPHDSVFRG